MHLTILHRWSDTYAFSSLQDYRYQLEICCYALQIIALEAYYVTR